MANNKFKAAVKKAKALYKSGRYKKFSDAVKAAYKKCASPKKKRRKVGDTLFKETRSTGRKKTYIRKRTAKGYFKGTKRVSAIGSIKKQVEKKLGNAFLEHFKTQSIKRTQQLDKTIAGLKKKLRSL